MSRGDQGPGRGTAAHDVNPARDGHTENMLPEREVQFPRTVHHVHRRPFGLSPVPVLVALAVFSLVIALLLLALGSWVAGVLFLAVSGVAAGLSVVAIRREPDEEASRLALTAADRADGFAKLSAIAIRASTRTGLELATLWGRRQRLRFELRRQLAPLGEAVHREDRDRAERLKAQAEQLDEALRDTDRRVSAAIAALRDQINRERATSQRTERFSVAEEPAVSGRNGRR